MLKHHNGQKKLSADTHHFLPLSADNYRTLKFSLLVAVNRLNFQIFLQPMQAPLTSVAGVLIIKQGHPRSEVKTSSIFVYAA